MELGVINVRFSASKYALLLHRCFGLRSKKIGFSIQEGKEILPHQEALVEDQVAFLERQEWFTNIVMPTIGNVSFLGIFTSSLHVLATVPVEELVSEYFGARILFLLPK